MMFKTERVRSAEAYAAARARCGGAFAIVIVFLFDASQARLECGAHPPIARIVLISHDAPFAWTADMLE